MIEQSNESFKIINQDKINPTVMGLTDGLVKPSIKILPPTMHFKTLNTSHLEEICHLINNHYKEDQQRITRNTYSRDFIYWFIKYIPPGFIVGLILNKKLIGMVSSMFTDMIIHDTKIKMPSIHFLCVQSSVRKLGLATALLNEILDRIISAQLPYSFLTKVGSQINSDFFSQTQDYVIPINHHRLRRIGFLTEDYPKINVDQNKLSLMTRSDIEPVMIKLNHFLTKYQIKPFFTLESAEHFLLPRKKIVYSFCHRDKNNQIIDFVSVYQNYLYCLEQNKVISVAQLSFYFHQSMDLTELIKQLIVKLADYHFDQLIFRNFADNEKINLDKFSTTENQYYYFYRITTPKSSPNQIISFPF